MLPVDSTERDRLDVMHTMIKTVRPAASRLTHVPPETFFDRPGKSGGIIVPQVLDLGCGTGLWMIQMSEEYKNVCFHGYDINALVPERLHRNIVPCVPFDVEKPWNLGDGRHDMIHCQLMQGSIQNWTYLFQQAYRHLAPGGWFESVEIDWQPRCDDNSMPRNPDGSLDSSRSSLMFWWDRVHKAYGKAQHPLIYNQNIEEELRARGFKDVMRHSYQIPLCGWNTEDLKAHRVGSWWNVAMSHQRTQPTIQDDRCCGLEAMSLVPLMENDLPEGSAHSWTAAKVRELCASAIDEASNVNVHAYNRLEIVVARKPRLDET
jgi:SAM-dependent methyltransferase